MNAIGFYSFYILSWILFLLPLRLLYGVAYLLYIFAFYIIKYRKKTVLLNLKNSFPDKTEKEIEELARKFYIHFCDSLIEIIKLIHISPKELEKRVVFNNIELFDRLYKENKNVILVSGHYGNWTWMVRLPLYLKHKPTVIYKALHNIHFNEFEKKKRARYGAILIRDQEAYKKLLELNNKKELFLCWFLTDQRPPKPLHFWTNFLNQDTPVFLGAEKVARKVHAAVVYMEINKIKRGYYSVDFKLLVEDASKTLEGQITEMHTRELEKTILKNPAYWLWSHKRWKHVR
ncbi:MAG: hypothetical protein A2275_16810 [Bacteroidetes bacterium RIFOXYA12_FULL_35_11]|nr:MAG: hypothetical protein A2X01_03150 [Bacteroidetes bacterium GWF2_35_48]OFY82465.1 MAG: hypothetical protein A2275_16810 [Bacteroidetes bacterium RIFOXYA12_FULL_35_11]OFY95828.1 MAG: hypothetical protein A2491_13585 [Bacteroidetes bacterium RIFOXYC12_FULL_35_7]